MCCPAQLCTPVPSLLRCSGATPDCPGFLQYDLKMQVRGFDVQLRWDLQLLQSSSMRQLRSAVKGQR